MPIATTLPPNPTAADTSLPPPQTFDLIPPLHSLLARLLLPRDPTDPSTPSPETATPISPKELGPAASVVTNKIHRARIAIRELPGVEMSLEEQEHVIEELEEEVRRLDEAMDGIRRAAREMMRGQHGGDGFWDAMVET